MLRLTDDQMTHVFRTVEPLHPTDRSAFLADVAAALNGHEIGDGLVGRVGRGVLRWPMPRACRSLWRWRGCGHSP